MLSYRSRWKPPWERWLLGYTRMWCSLPGVKYIYEQWLVENNSVCLIEPTVIWHQKKWNAPKIAIWQQLWQYHESWTCYSLIFFRHLPCLLQSQVGQSLSPTTNCLIRYLFRPIHFLNSVKDICITECPSSVGNLYKPKIL